ncbi:hypothetical protein [Hansschlegelia zhihuaiae]|uniref:Uncharacterized protein n=1 Tax=Hansschlegelia zhihuaiae TaxID=405005 RepID=A0A4Q0MF28_9HYPH|nr:hypothetical protein [Hansschlegelia zhihuaiae]RXF72091.1 hypothetical protein EK403_14880 [Hansschlegelia zhihuaiae]
MEADLSAHLRTCASAFAEAKGVELVTVARRACGDWRFFDRLETGASFTIRKYDDAMAWFSDNWPEGLAWPVGVPRPARAAPQPDEAAEAEAAA